MVAHPGHSAAGTSGLPVVVAALVAAGYLYLAAGQRRRGRSWPRSRDAAFTGGAMLVGLALAPTASPFPPGDFRGHMLQHLIIGMVAPIGLALGAPATLLLRSVPPRARRLIGRVPRGRPARLATHPVTALTFNVGGLAALYATPLYERTTGPVGHHLVHAHFLVAGYLFAWSIAGRDPAPRRPSVGARVVVLAAAIVGHAVLAQLMYAGLLVRAPVPVEELRGAADLMYYGGDLAELLLALVLLAGRRPGRGAGPVRRPVAGGGRAAAPIRPSGG